MTSSLRSSRSAEGPLRWAPPLLLAALLLATPGCYVLHVASSQLGVLWGREDVEDVLARPDLDPQRRAGLRLVQDVRRFAFDELGLTSTQSYTCYYDTGADPIAWNVSASKPDALAPCMWWFPFVGAVPYLGYFDPSLAVQAARELKGQGLDVALLPVAAYSTLGWFADPVFSSMLDRDEAELAATIIHELAHGTVWVSGDVELNENLASFIGDQGARDYFRARGGADDPALTLAERREREALLMNDALGELHDELARVFEATGSREAKLAFKREAIARFRQRFAAELRPQLAGDDYDWVLSQGIELNNAILLSFRRYHGDEGLLRALYAGCGEDLRGLIAALQEVAEEDDPRAALEAKVGQIK